MAEVLDCDLEVNEFEIQSRYNVHYQTYALGKNTNLFISTAMD